MAALKLVIFDCDGTLVDSQHSIVRAMRFAFEHNGLQPPSHDKILSVVGLHLYECMRTLQPNADETLLNKLVQGYSDSFREHRASGQEEPPLYPGTRAMLDALDATGTFLAVATGKSRRGLTHTLKIHDLETMFVEKRTSDDGPGKPNPDIILDICASLAVHPSEAVMIGDTTFDIDMAAYAKMPSIGVDWGYHENDALRQAGAYTILHTWDDLFPALRQQFDVPDGL